MEYQLVCLRGVHELMLRPCRHDHQIPGLDILVLARNSGFTSPGSESQCLVDRVDLCCGQYVDHRSPYMPHTSSPISPPTGIVISTTCE